MSDRKPLSEETCARCGEPIEPTPGVTFVASTVGSVWHYDCAPSRNTPYFDPPAVRTTHTLKSQGGSGEANNPPESDK